MQVAHVGGSVIVQQPNSINTLKKIFPSLKHLVDNCISKFTGEQVLKIFKVSCIHDLVKFLTPLLDSYTEASLEDLCATVDKVASLFPVQTPEHEGAFDLSKTLVVGKRFECKWLSDGEFLSMHQLVTRIRFRCLDCAKGPNLRLDELVQKSGASTDQEKAYFFQRLLNLLMIEADFFQLLYKFIKDEIPDTGLLVAERSKGGAPIRSETNGFLYEISEEYALNNAWVKSSPYIKYYEIDGAHYISMQNEINSDNSSSFKSGKVKAHIENLQAKTEDLVVKSHLASILAGLELCHSVLVKEEKKEKLNLQIHKSHELYSLKDTPERPVLAVTPIAYNLKNFLKLFTLLDLFLKGEGNEKFFYKITPFLEAYEKNQEALFKNVHDKLIALKESNPQKFSQYLRDLTKGKKSTNISSYPHWYVKKIEFKSFLLNRPQEQENKPEFSLPKKAAHEPAKAEINKENQPKEDEEEVPQNKEVVKGAETNKENQPILGEVNETSRREKKTKSSIPRKTAGETIVLGAPSINAVGSFEAKMAATKRINQIKIDSLGAPFPYSKAQRVTRWEGQKPGVPLSEAIFPEAKYRGLSKRLIERLVIFHFHPVVYRFFDALAVKGIWYNERKMREEVCFRIYCEMTIGISNYKGAYEFNIDQEDVCYHICFKTDEELKQKQFRIIEDQEFPLLATTVAKPKEFAVFEALVEECGSHVSQDKAGNITILENDRSLKMKLLRPRKTK